MMSSKTLNNREKPLCLHHSLFSLSLILLYFSLPSFFFTLILKYLQKQVQKIVQTLGNAQVHEIRGLWHLLGSQSQGALAGL